MVHILCGNGKGKTTSAMGQAIRGTGNDLKVLFIQFYKNEDSAEITELKKSHLIKCLFPEEPYVLFEEMTDEKKNRIKKSFEKTIEKAKELETQFDMIILDEVLDAYMFQTIDKDKFADWIRDNKEKREYILTGRNYDKKLEKIADYISNIQMIKHPYNNGIQGRKGIEF